jgi:inward rectifier potassium channel
MGMRKRKPATPVDIEVVGQPKPLLRDLYHSFLRAPWSVSLGAVAIAFFAVNLLFAIAYDLVGGVAEAHSFADLFFFAVETSGTIGYGTMHPATPAAHIIVTLEALVGLLIAALSTGLLFAKFSRPYARMEFADHPVVTLYDGVPTLQFRLGNQRDSLLLEATVRVVILRTETTREGVTMYRMYDLQLDRERSPALARSWTVIHRMIPGSPLHGATPELLEKQEVELVLTVSGVDDVSAQAQHGQHRYNHTQVRWGMRYADMLSERPDGVVQVDVRRFHHLEPTRRTQEFPWGDAEG